MKSPIEITDTLLAGSFYEQIHHAKEQINLEGFYEASVDNVNGSVVVTIDIAGIATFVNEYQFTATEMQEAARFINQYVTVSPKEPSLAKEGDLMGVSA